MIKQRSLMERNKGKISIIFLIFLLMIFFAFTVPVCAVSTSSVDISTDELFEQIDLTEMENYFNSLSFEQKSVFGGDFNEFIKTVTSGQASIKFETIFAYFGSLIGINFKSVFPTALLILVVTIASGILSNIKSEFASASMQKIINFATVSCVCIISFGLIFSLIEDTSALINSIKEQIETVFPPLFVLMSALGADGSTAIFSPAVAVLSFSVTELVSVIILPTIIASIVTTVVGSITESGRLDKITKFFESFAKGLMYSAFFIFIAFLSVQGITAGVRDNLKVRTAKFALSKYVPVIGGYLAEGFNLVLAGTVLIKNAVGLTAVVLLFVTILPVVIKVVVTSLILKLVGALCEPFSAVGGVVSKIGNSLGILISVVLGIAFCYFLFLILLISSGNLVL